MTGFRLGRADYYEEGDWNAICSMCGRKRKASTLVKNWQGMWRCEIHNEPRHSQDFVRGVPDVQTPPWAQRPADRFIAIGCTPVTQSALAGIGVSGCAKAGFASPLAIFRT